MRWDARTSADANSGIPVPRQCSYLWSTAQPYVPLESIKKGCVWSTSGSLTIRRFPEDVFTCSEFWAPHTVPSESHSDKIRQRRMRLAGHCVAPRTLCNSGEVVTQVDISDMVLPGVIWQFMFANSLHLLRSVSSVVRFKIRRGLGTP